MPATTRVRRLTPGVIQIQPPVGQAIAVFGAYCQILGMLFDVSPVLERVVFLLGRLLLLGVF